MTRFPHFLAGILLLASCTASHDPKGLAESSWVPAYSGLDGRITEVAIVDAREGTTTRPLDTPTMSLPWDDDEVRPELATRHRQILTSELKRHFRGGDELHARITVTEGAKRFVASTFNEAEEVEFAITLEVYEPGEGQTAAPVSGHARVRTSSMDAEGDVVEQLYEKAIAASVEEAALAWAARAPGTGSR